MPKTTALTLALEGNVMFKRSFLTLAAASSLSMFVAPVAGQSVYLNEANITVAVGAGTSPGTFNNTFNNGQTILKVIDAPSANAEEFHNQSTHIWYTADNNGGGLELTFDFLARYDIGTLHFWNYTAENYDVDNIDFNFFGGDGSLVGSLSLQPALGSPGGIFAEDLELPAPLGVRYVTAFLTGSNKEVDFQNIGFTAVVSSVPEPGPIGMMALGLSALLWRIRRRSGA